MADNKIKGIVKVVSEDKGGIFLFTKDDQTGSWWNSVGDLAKNQVKKGLKGTEIELTIVNLEKRKFSHVNILNCQSVQTNDKDDYWAKRLERDIVQDRYRGKGAALNTAVEVIKAKNGDLKQLTDKEVLDKAKLLAQDIIQWIEQK